MGSPPTQMARPMADRLQKSSRESKAKFEDQYLYDS
jgi:hypothetical protein|tara:strand:+ start:287 stop:394 length:108 start_codon:yes stop_codon:yes gene_type:complete